MGFSRLLHCTQEDGTFLLRDNTDGTRNILSFLSGNEVFHLYIDQLEDMCLLGKCEKDLLLQIRAH